MKNIFYYIEDHSLNLESGFFPEGFNFYMNKTSETIIEKEKILKLLFLKGINLEVSINDNYFVGRINIKQLKKIIEVLKIINEDLKFDDYIITVRGGVYQNLTEKEFLTKAKKLVLK